MGSTPENQLDYYKLVYSLVETSIDNNGALKGVAFWRWDAINDGALEELSSLDAALTLSARCSLLRAQLLCQEPEPGT